MSKTDTTPPPAADAKPAGPVYSETITLEEPILRGDSRIETIKLRRPRAGELRGINLRDLQIGEADAFLDLLPRIAEPLLTSDDADCLCPGDLLQVTGAVTRFFMNKAEQEAAARMIEQAQQKLKI